MDSRFRGNDRKKHFATVHNDIVTQPDCGQSEVILKPRLLRRPTAGGALRNDTITSKG